MVVIWGLPLYLLPAIVTTGLEDIILEMILDRPILLEFIQSILKLSNDLIVMNPTSQIFDEQDAFLVLQGQANAYQPKRAI